MRSGEWAKSRKGIDRKSNRTRRKNKRGDREKWRKTDSPEIPDRRETSEIPSLPLGVATVKPVYEIPLTGIYK